MALQKHLSPPPSPFQHHLKNHPHPNLSRLNGKPLLIPMSTFKDSLTFSLQPQRRFIFLTLNLYHYHRDRGERARKSRIVSYASSAGSDEGGHVTRTDVYRNRTSMASLFTVDGGSSEDDVEELDAVAEEDEEEDEFETRDNVEITNETVGPALGPQSPTAEHSAPREWRSSPSAEPATPISRHRRFADGFDSDEDVVEAEDEDDDDRVLGEGVDLTATRRLLLDAYGSDDVRAPVEKQMDGSPPILPLKEDVDFFGDAPRLSLGGSTFVESPKPLDRSASPSKLGESVRFKIGDVMSLDRSRGKKGAKSPEPDLKTVRFAETLPSNGAAPSLKLRSLLQRSNSTSSPSRSASTSSTIPTTSPPTVPSNTTSWAKGLGGLFDRASTNEKKEGWNRVKKKGSIDSRLGTVRGVDVERSTTIASTYKSESDGVGLLFSSETTKAEDDFKLFGDDELVALGIGLPRTSTDSNQKDPWTQAWLVEDKSSDHASSDRRNSTNSTDSSIPPPLPPRRRSVISLASSPPLPLPPQEESALPPLPPPSPPPPSIRSISSTSTGGLTPWAKGTVHPDDTPEPAKTKLDHLLETLMEDIDTEIDRHAEISRVDHAERAPRDGIPRSQSTGSSIGSDATMVRSVMSRSVTGLSEVEDEKRNILSRSATGLSEAEDEKRRDSISIPSRMSVLPGAVGFEDMLAKLESVYMGAK
ncbi:hypothetical protein BC829DRAFT_116119 [Chytridium lagenaria]|nr:hypothetical protein BC829DRAFT_116119 [Chytridium lagenaria]